MAASLDPKRIQITIQNQGASPDWATSADDAFLLGHLGTGWSGSDWTADAITATASIPVSNPGQAEFGFVQLARANRFQAYYAGRLSREGSVTLDYFVPPALKQKIMLDGGGSLRDPWYREPISQATPGGRSAKTGDHPGMLVPLKIQNRVCSYVPNYLFHVIMDREFWTILTVREPTAQLNYVGYYHWQLIYEFMIRWHDGRPIKFINRSSLRIVDPKGIGRPPDLDLQALLSNPTGERANAIGNWTLKLTPGGSLPNRRDQSERFANVPDVFWS